MWKDMASDQGIVSGDDKRRGLQEHEVEGGGMEYEGRLGRVLFVLLSLLRLGNRGEYARSNDR